METTSSFGYWIRRRRKALDLTQAELARRVACTLSTIKKLELDERRPSALMAGRLAECLQIPAPERDAFIKVALAVHSPERLAVESRPLAAEAPPERKTNLPLPTSRLIGRLELMAEISGLLRRPDVRLVTLTGPGGVGKTRLALQLTRKLLPEFTDGAWLIELAPLSNPQLVPQAALTALNLPGSASRPPLELLINYLSTKHILLVLDNCEHLLEACAGLADALLCACERLVILCTSREGLNTPAEYTWQVPPLSLPDLNASSSLQELANSEAMDLFLERAGHVQPAFKLTEGNAPAVAQVCCRLDGLPLAIELAAARLPVLSVEEIDGRLDDAMHLLEGGFRTSARRQHTMQATIAWSYDLLPASEQALLRRLAVFAGGWTLEAAEEVCPIEGNLVKRDNVLALLSRLVTKSLVRRAAGQDGEKRFLLLETIRQFADEKLFEAGEMEAVRQRHLEYYLVFAEQASAELARPQRGAWLERMDLELENLRLALHWSFKHAPALGLRLARAHGRFCVTRNLYSEGVDWLKKLLELPENKAPTPYRARALGQLAFMAIFSAPSPETWVSESLAISQSLQDDEGRAYALRLLGMISGLRRNDFERARLQLTESLEIYRALDDRWGMGQVLLQLAQRASICGEDPSTRRSYYEQAIALLREVGDLNSAAAGLGKLAEETAELEADLATAYKMAAEALALLQQTNATGMMASVLHTLCHVSTWQGEYEAARNYSQEYEQSEHYRSSGGYMIGVQVNIAYLDRLAGRADLAMPVLENCLVRLRACDPQVVTDSDITLASCELAAILVRRGDLQRAKELISQAPQTTAVVGVQVGLLHCMGDLAMAEQHGEEALERYLQSLQFCQSNHYKLATFLALEGIAGALDLLSNPQLAARLLSAAAAFRQKIGAPVSPWDLPVYKRLNAALLQRMGVQAFAQAWADGQALSFDQAVEEALKISL